MEIPEKIFYKGMQYPLTVTYDCKIGNVAVFVRQHELEVLIHPYLEGKITSDGFKNYLLFWLKRQATTTFLPKIREWSGKTGLRPMKVRIKDQKSRWGSCSSKKNVNLNWRLIMAPETVLDYVIVHELCHLQFLNHSKVFWYLVASFIPDFQTQKSWLKKYGPQLLLT